jgi:hypothetical protein
MLGLGHKKINFTYSKAIKASSMNLKNDNSKTDSRVLGSMVAVAFQIIFCTKMHANDFFYF